MGKALLERDRKKKKMFEVLQAQPMRHELITWCRLWPLREVEEKRGSKSMGFEPTFGIEENYVSWAQLWGILGNKPNSVCFFFFNRERELRVVGWTFLLGKVLLERDKKKKKKNMFDVCLQAQPMRHELITWCRLSPLREVRK